LLLASQGKKVLAIDCNPQANLTLNKIQNPEKAYQFARVRETAAEG
jgi:cellulose biosynthesis protein BcsQ